VTCDGEIAGEYARAVALIGASPLLTHS